MCSSPFNFSINFFIDSLSLEGDDDDDEEEEDAEVATGAEKCCLHMHT
jgi:hypothetical protein